MDLVIDLVEDYAVAPALQWTNKTETKLKSFWKEPDGSESHESPVISEPERLALYLLIVFLPLPCPWPVRAVRAGNEGSGWGR